MNKRAAGELRVETVPTVVAAYSYIMEDHPMPGTLWVRPTAGNTFTVAYSTDGGVNYQTMTALNGATAYSEVVVSAGFTNLRITPSGVQGGSWGVC